MANGQRAGVRQTNDCLPDSLADPCWSTGTDCSGFVSRCWQLSGKRNTKDLFGVAHQISYDSVKMGDALDDTTAQDGRHVVVFFDRPGTGLIRVMESRTWTATPWENGCDTTTYSQQDFFIARGFIPMRYNNVYDPPANTNPEIEGHIHCQDPQIECQNCFKYGHQYTLEIDAYDPDGDSMYYEWFSYWGWFIVDAQYVSACTTAQNYVTYLVPSFGNQDRLDVFVRDDRGGWASIEEAVGIYAEGTRCRCGDANGDLNINGSDVVYLINYFFVPGSPAPNPMEKADANNDCVVNASDVVYLINYLFVANSPLPECCWIH
jgi:hypothetical protein